MYINSWSFRHYFSWTKVWGNKCAGVEALGLVELWSRVGLLFCKVLSPSGSSLHGAPSHVEPRVGDELWGYLRLSMFRHIRPGRDCLKCESILLQTTITPFLSTTPKK